MEETVCFPNSDFSFPEEVETEHPIKISKCGSKEKLRQNLPKRSKKNTVKKVTNRLTKITIKRRKYIKTKREDLKTSKSLFEVSAQQLPEKNSSGAPHLRPVVDVLEKFNFKYEVLAESHKHNSFFLQDAYMNAFSKYYPEYVCVDFLCEIPELELNLCLFISVDGNGYCEVIAIGLIKSFDSGLLWLCEIFKKYNSNWHKIKLITCDKKEQTLDVIKLAFPEKLILISFFHSMKILKRDLFDLDQNVSEQDITEIIHIFERMVYVTDESSYAELLKQIKLMPPAIVTYFRKTWHQRKDSWALGQQLNSKTFLKAFNSYLLCIRKEIRPMVNTLYSVENVVEKLGFIFNLMRKERFLRFMSVFQTTSVSSQQLHYQKYSKFLTQYSAELVFEQLNDAANVKNIRKLSCGKYVCASKDIVSTNACSCNFFQLFALPCSHIFAVRKYLSLPLFSEIIPNRWISGNYQNTYLDMHSIFSSGNKQYDFESIDPCERFQKCFKLFSLLWPLLTECSENVSQDRLLVLKNLVNAWNNDIKVNINTSEVKSNPCSSNMELQDESTDYWKEIYGVSLKDVLDSDNDFSPISLCFELSNRVTQMSQ